jgi:nicotinamide-nucleotide amidase
MTDFAGLVAVAERLLAVCRERRLTLAAAESCTGGLLAGALTEIPGASDVFERGFVTYSNAAKVEMLGIDPALIARHGAVSEEVAQAMAAGVLARSAADLAVAVTGIAGPGGGSAEKPVGLVHLAAAGRRRPPAHRALNIGNVGRAKVRLASVAAAFELVLTLVEAR